MRQTGDEGETISRLRGRFGEAMRVQCWAASVQMKLTSQEMLHTALQIDLR